MSRALLVLVFAAAATSACQQQTPCKAACSPFFSDLQLADWDQTLKKASLLQ